MEAPLLALPRLLWLLGASFGFAVCGSLVAARLAGRIGLLDRPAQGKLHRQPTPLLGGAAMLAAIALALAPSFGEAKAGVVQPLGLLAAALLVFAVGLWDDFRRLPVVGKLLAQGAVVGMALVAGAVINTGLPGWADLALSGLWMVGVTNALNLLDNMDGVAAGVAAIAACGLFLLLPAGLPSALSLVLCGACLGFLCLNFSPARLFMGDSGSLLIGLLLAVLAIEAQRAGGGGGDTSWLAPLVVLAVPLFDTTLVVVSRLRRGLNPMTHSGTDHLAHRILRLGWPVAGAARLLYAVAAMAAVAGVVLGRSGGGATRWVLGVALFSAGLTIWRLERRPGLIHGTLESSLVETPVDSGGVS